MEVETTETTVKSSNLLAADSPQTGQRSLSSVSNSPVSVRVNDLKARDSEEENKEATNSEDDIDMLDAKTPLLKEKSSTIIVEGGGGSGSSHNTNGRLVLGRRFLTALLVFAMGYLRNRMRSLRTRQAATDVYSSLRRDYFMAVLRKKIRRTAASDLLRNPGFVSDKIVLDAKDALAWLGKPTDRQK